MGGGGRNERTRFSERLTYAADGGGEGRGGRNGDPRWGGEGRYRPRRQVSRSGSRPSRRGKYTVVRPQKQIPSQSPDREGEVVGDFSENYTFVPGASPPRRGGSRGPRSSKVGGLAPPPPPGSPDVEDMSFVKYLSVHQNGSKSFFAKCSEVKRYVVSGHLL